MERKRSIQRSDSSIPSPLKEGEGRGSPLTQDRDQGPHHRSGSGRCRSPGLPRSRAPITTQTPTSPPLSPPSQLINPLVMARFAILRGSMADSGVRRGLSSDVCRETRPPPPARPARPCGLPHTPLLALPSPLDPTSSTSCNVSLCSVLLSTRPGSLGTGSTWADGSVCVTQPPLELHQWPLYWDGRLKMFQWNPPSGRHGSCPSQLPTSPCPDPD